MSSLKPSVLVRGPLGLCVSLCIYASLHVLIICILIALLPLFESISIAQSSTPKLLRPFAVPVNTEANEDEPHVADNGLTLYWTSDKEGKDDLWVCRRKSLRVSWPSRGQIVEDYVSTKADDRSLFATAGRFPHYLYFATRKDEKTRPFDLYVAVKHDADKAWSAPTPLANVNTSVDELHPWLTADGKMLYFSRKTPEGWRVGMATRTVATGPGGWGEPILLDLPVGFHHPTVTADGNSMYLQGPLDKGRWGLFLSRRDGKGWSRPQPLDQLNHPEGKTGDRSPNLTRDGRFLYFASDRPGGKGGLDLWGIAVTELSKR